MTGRTRPKMAKSLLLLITIVCTILNLFIFQKRHDGYIYSYTDYARLYYPKELPTIIGFDVLKSGRLVVKLSSSLAGKWEISYDDGRKTTISGDYPIIDLLSGSHTYTISSRKAEKPEVRLVIKTDYTPAAIYAEADNSTPDNYHVVHSSIPIGRFKRYPITAFTYEKRHYSERDIREVSQIISHQIGIHIDDPTDLKITKLALSLLRKLGDKRGIPSDKMNSLSPFRQYEYALNDRSSIWCSNFAEIYTFFATVAGIPTRRVGVSGSLDGVKLSGHEFTECFIRERRQWAFVDIASRKLFVKSIEGDFLNTVDLFHINRIKAYEGLTATIYDANGIALVPYSQVRDSEEYYFSNDASLIFRFPYKNRGSISSKLNRYILNPDLAYSLSDSNWKHYLKVGLFYAEMLLFSFWFSLFIGYSFRRFASCRCNR